MVNIVQNTIAICIGIGVVSDAVPVKVSRLSVVRWEGVVVVENPITVHVVILAIGNAIVVHVGLVFNANARVKVIEVFTGFNAVTIGIRVAVVANTIAVKVRPFICIVREGIIVVVDAVVIIVRIGFIRCTVLVKVGQRRQFVHHAQPNSDLSRGTHRRRGVDDVSHRSVTQEGRSAKNFSRFLVQMNANGEVGRD